MDSPDWRLWSNAFPTWSPKGMRLERLAEKQRSLLLDIVKASLGPTGYATVRAAMKLNGALGLLVGDYHDTLTEYTYWFTVFGEPASGDPWGWQLMGHHVDVHCVFVGTQLVLAPVFLGAEPASAETGPYAGVSAFGRETDAGLALRRALRADQEGRFLQGSSVLSADLPEELAGPFNGRHLAGAGADNLVLPLDGIPGADLDGGQRGLLMDLVAVYTSRLPTEHVRRKCQAVADHLDETRFATIVREPHGNDYGKDLLAQHYARHHTR